MNVTARGSSHVKAGYLPTALDTTKWKDMNA